MSYLEHEPEKAEGCGCPSCFLYNEYLKAYANYKNRKAYRTFEIANGIGPPPEDKMNELQLAGYELAHVIPGSNRIVVMRSIPPMAPTATDVIQELLRRKGDSSDAVKDIENFGPTIGGMQ